MTTARTLGVREGVSARVQHGDQKVPDGSDTAFLRPEQTAQPRRVTLGKAHRRVREDDVLQVSRVVPGLVIDRDPARSWRHMALSVPEHFVITTETQEGIVAPPDITQTSMCFRGWAVTKRRLVPH